MDKPLRTFARRRVVPLRVQGGRRARRVRRAWPTGARSPAEAQLAVQRIYHARLAMRALMSPLPSVLSQIALRVLAFASVRHSVGHFLQNFLVPSRHASVLDGVTRLMPAAHLTQS